MEAGSLDIQHGLEEVNQELQHVEKQIERLLQKQQRLLQRKEQLELQSSRLHELSLQAGSTDWEKSDYPWSAKLHSLRETVFGIKKFRPLQEKTMNASLSGRDVILLMPTGGGKSLCYQLTALVSKGFTLVVSPLVSLMEDQTMALEELGVNATVLNSNTPPELVKDVHRQMIDARSELKLLYVTPEKIAKSKRFMACLEKAYKAKLLTRIAIDEVHCCSQWGHDFRPDYKILGLLKRQFTETPILGLTATATMDVLDDVKGILGLQGCQVFRAGFNRPNLFYEVRPKPSKHADFVEELIRLINGEFKGQSGIIYCFSRKDAETMAESLKDGGIQAHPYHAMLDAHYRSQVHKNWKENNIQVVVATVAFGMGIDKPDVRFVIHHSISKSMENYYQESGRAGRDDEPAKCIAYYGLPDVFRQSTMVVTEQTGQQKLYNMVAYCVAPATCRRTLIGQHFGERWEGQARCNKMCDVCRSGAKVVEKDMLPHLQRIYTILDHKSKGDNRVTALKLTEELMSKKGVAALDKDQAKKMTGLDYGYLIAHFLLEGYLREDFHFTPYNTISYIIPGPKARIIATKPQRSITVPFKLEDGHMSKVKVHSGKGQKEKGSRGDAPATKTREDERKKGRDESGRGSEVRKTEGEGHRGKTKKRKLVEEASIIDLCSDDSDDEDFTERKPTKKSGKSAKLSTTMEGTCNVRDSVGSKGASTAQKCQGGTDEKVQSAAAQKSSSGTTVLDRTDAGSSKNSSNVTEHSGQSQPAKHAPSKDNNSESGPFTFKSITSTQSLASSHSKGAHSANQGPGKESQDLARASKPNQPGSSTSEPSSKSNSRSNFPDSQRSPPAAVHRRAPSMGLSPGSDVEMDLRSVYTQQLMNLGSEGESFNRENSSFTMSTSFSGSEDGLGNTPASRRRKGTMRRVDSMDTCDEDDSMRDDYETLKKVYSDQMKRLDDPI
ncbi:ATP-dependent DNA helicase Q1-like [Lytechinus variegatus]|uniref:ATP-dependent DNA helicase Q1-like n=1 Tax=Lytechinus variegatus TaxID=7654 RepID=UPI001BB2A115|nr:ATP-dependent DNA helicase Q1-like [Lytechinus variegatus]